MSVSYRFLMPGVEQCDVAGNVGEGDLCCFYLAFSSSLPPDPSTILQLPHRNESQHHTI